MAVLANAVGAAQSADKSVSRVCARRWLARFVIMREGMMSIRTRWLLAPVGLIALWACNDRKIQTPVPAPSVTQINFFEQNLNNDIDILFLIDDSSSMTTVQNNLIANFPIFINVLKTLPGGLPNVHLGVVSQDMGAGAFTSSVPGCQTPDLGNLINMPRASTNPACATNTLNNGAHFIESLANGSQNNFTGDISTVFSCIADLGASGCGFEHQLEAVRAALGDPMGDMAHHIPSRTLPAGNVGFLRDKAYLAVIFITNEDDSSATPDSLMFDPSQNSNSDPLGPLASFRCTEFGITCDGLSANMGRIPRMAGGPYTGCHGNDPAFYADPLHYLIAVQWYIDYFKRIKSSPNKVILAAVAAPAEPFATSVDPQSGFTMLNHSCISANGTFGDPGVRLKQVIDSVGDLGTYISICQDSYADAMSVIAQKISHVIGPQCISGVIADATKNYSQGISMPSSGQVVDPTLYSCTVEDVQYPGTAMQKSLGAVQPCNPAGQATGQCFALVGDSKCMEGSDVRVVVCRNGFDPSAPGGKFCPDGPVSAPDGDTAIVRCATLP
jgi:hypothetical protein